MKHIKNALYFALTLVVLFGLVGAFASTSFASRPPVNAGATADLTSRLGDSHGMIMTAAAFNAGGEYVRPINVARDNWYDQYVTFPLYPNTEIVAVETNWRKDLTSADWTSAVDGDGVTWITVNTGTDAQVGGASATFTVTFRKTAAATVRSQIGLGMPPVALEATVDWANHDQDYEMNEAGGYFDTYYNYIQVDAGATTLSDIPLHAGTTATFFLGYQDKDGIFVHAVELGTCIAPADCDLVAPSGSTFAEQGFGPEIIVKITPSLGSKYAGCSNIGLDTRVENEAACVAVTP